MDPENGNLSEIEDWIKELLPDFAAEMGIGGVTLPSCDLSSFNLQNEGIATMASSSNSNNNNNNTSMWQQYQQSDNHMGSNFRQPQSLQNQVVDPASERLNTYQFPMQSNYSYPGNLGQHQQTQASNQMSTMTNKSLERQSGFVPERSQPELLRVSPFHQARNVTLVDQMNPGNQTQAQTTRLGCGPLQALSASTLQSQLTNSTEWMDRAYFKILQMKEECSPDLLTLYRRSQELRQSANNVETLNKCDKIKMSVERVMTFLNISRSDIPHWRKEKLVETMNDVIKYTNQARASNANAQIKQNQPIVGPNNSIRLQNIARFNNSQQQPSFDNRPNAAHPFNPAQLFINSNNNNNNSNNNNNFLGQWDFNFKHSATAVSHTLNEQTMKRSHRNNKQQVLQRKKAEEQNKQRRAAAAGLINQRRPPLSAAAVAGANSPQNSPQSSLGVDQKDFCFSATVSATASSCAFPSPLTPLTPCSKLADFAKSPLSIDENCKISPNSANPPLLDTSQKLIFADAYKGAIDSAVNTESAEKKSSLEEKVDPVKRLVDAVTTMSPRALNSAVQDIAAVVNLTDRIAASFLHEDSTKIVFQDLADDISKFRMQSAPEDQMEIETRFCEKESTKKLKKKPNDMLLKEIKEINQRFMEVKADVMSNMDEVARTGENDGILVQFSYVPVGPAAQQMIHKLLLELIVPADYPAFSPKVSEKMSRSCGDSEEGKHMWTKAKSNFGIKLRTFPQPITVKQMARAWEVSARDAFLEYAQKTGGGSFSTTYYGRKMSGPGYSFRC